MGIHKYVDALLDYKTGSIHTAYLASIISVSKDHKTAKIQPLGLYKDKEGNTKAQSVLTKVPICEHVRHWSLVKQNLTIKVSDTYTGGGSATITPNPHPKEDNIGHIKIEPLKAGDIVVCVCCEQNISEAKRGVNALPPVGRFSMSDSVIVGVL